MRYICSDYEECGFATKTFEDDLDDQICPNCFGLLLMYEEGTQPSWISSMHCEGSLLHETYSSADSNIKKESFLRHSNNY